MTDDPTLMTCRAVDAPGQRDPFCGLPAVAQSVKVAGVPLCEEHLTDHVSGDLARNGNAR